MPTNLDLIRLVNMWQAKARESESTIEIETLEKCASQIMKLIHAGAVVVESRAVKPESHPKAS